MGEYSFCNELKEEYKIEELNSETLKYRIDGFIHACNMDLEDSSCVKCISPSKLSYINKNRNDENIKYNVNFAKGYDYEKGKDLILLGKYNDLNVYFVNYFDSDKRKDRINEIPFHISIGQIYHDIPYQLDIETISSTHTKFIIKRNKKDEILPDTVVFNANVLDFSKILRLVKSFVHNPELVFIAYNEVINKKEVNLTNKELDVALVNDEKLDKPLGKISKIFRKIIG